MFAAGSSQVSNLAHCVYISMMYTATLLGLMSLQPSQAEDMFASLGQHASGKADKPCIAVLPAFAHTSVNLTSINTGYMRLPQHLLTSLRCMHVPSKERWGMGGDFGGAGMGRGRGRGLDPAGRRPMRELERWTPGNDDILPGFPQPPRRPWDGQS